MESISASLRHLLAGHRFSPAEYRRLAESPEFFRVLVEGLSDDFTANAAAAYTDLFSAIVEAPPQAHLVRTFCGKEPDFVFVLSRITLGADIAIVSPALDAAKRRFPKAQIYFVGPKKNYELFAADERILLIAEAYGRAGTFEDRLMVSATLRPVLEDICGDWDNAIVIDMDTRLTQLGFIPPCPPASYFYLDTRSIQGAGSLGELAAGWLAQTFEIETPQSYIEPPPTPGLPAICVSLGVGENQAKRVPDPFERKLLEGLSAKGPVLVDEGASLEETERVQRAAAQLPNVTTFHGSFAEFASHIARAPLYVGYDSAGQHAAAALGTPLITVFAGYPNRRFYERWRPTGRGSIKVVDATQPNLLQNIFGE